MPEADQGSDGAGCPDGEGATGVSQGPGEIYRTRLPAWEDHSRTGLYAVTTEGCSSQKTLETAIRINDPGGMPNGEGCLEMPECFVRHLCWTQLGKLWYIGCDPNNHAAGGRTDAR